MSVKYSASLRPVSSFLIRFLVATKTVLVTVVFTSLGYYISFHNKIPNPFISTLLQKISESFIKIKISPITNL